jgi:hypothetical protein
LNNEAGRKEGADSVTTLRVSAGPASKLGVRFKTSVPGPQTSCKKARSTGRAIEEGRAASSDFPDPYSARKRDIRSTLVKALCVSGNFACRFDRKGGIKYVLSVKMVAGRGRFCDASSGVVAKPRAESEASAAAMCVLTMFETRLDAIIA